MVESVIHRKVSFLPNGKRVEEKTADYPGLPDPYGMVPGPVEAFKPKFLLIREFFLTHRLPEDITSGIEGSPEAQISVDGTHDEDGRDVLQVDVSTSNVDELKGKVTVINRFYLYDNGVVIRRDIEEFWEKEERDGQNINVLNQTIKDQNFVTTENAQPLEYAYKVVKNIFS